MLYKRRWSICPWWWMCCLFTIRYTMLLCCIDGLTYIACFWNHLLEDHSVASASPTTLTSAMNDATTIFSMPFFISRAIGTKSIEHAISSWWKFQLSWFWAMWKTWHFFSIVDKPFWFGGQDVCSRSLFHGYFSIWRCNQRLAR